MGKTTSRSERRAVRSEDPTLSREANRLLTHEMREAVGAEHVTVPAGTPDRRAERHGTQSTTGAALQANRTALIVAFFALLTVGVIVSLATGSWWALVAAAAMHALGTMLVAASAIQLTTQAEHMSPETAARLEAEGVADPDRVFNDLMDDVVGAGRGHGTAEVVSPGANDRTMPPEVDPGVAGVEQQTAMTPSSAPSAPSGGDRVISGLPWYVVAGMMVVSLVFAIVLGGAGWVLPAVIWPLAAAWVLLQWRMSSGAEMERRPGDTSAAARKRVVPITAVVVIGVIGFMILMGIVADML